MLAPLIDSCPSVTEIAFLLTAALNDYMPKAFHTNNTEPHLHEAYDQGLDLRMSGTSTPEEWLIDQLAHLLIDQIRQTHRLDSSEPFRQNG